jgi:dipeptidyl aminopeptidase/acylaminoacyl peptidase
MTRTATDSLVAKLRAQNHDVRYLVFEDEGHNLLGMQNRYNFYRAMEEFCGEHLGGRVEETEQ